MRPVYGLLLGENVFLSPAPSVKLLLPRENDFFSPVVSVLYFLEGRVLFDVPELGVDLPLAGLAFFGLSPPLEGRFDDVFDLPSRPLPGLLNAIVFSLALSQREGSKLRFFGRFLDFF